MTPRPPRTFQKSAGLTFQPQTAPRAQPAGRAGPGRAGEHARRSPARCQIWDFFGGEKEGVKSSLGINRCSGVIKESFIHTLVAHLHDVVPSYLLPTIFPANCPGQSEKGKRCTSKVSSPVESPFSSWLLFIPHRRALLSPLTPKCGAQLYFPP